MVLSNPQTEDDNVCSVCEFRALPSVETKVRFLTDFSESEKTAEKGSLVYCTSLNGGIRMSSIRITDPDTTSQQIRHIFKANQLKLAFFATKTLTK